jgi:hypothetical protein
LKAAIISKDGFTISFYFDTFTEEKLVNPERITFEVIMTRLDILKQLF